MYAIAQLSQRLLDSAINTSDLTVSPETKLFEVVLQMSQRQPTANHVLVVEDEQVLGWFTASDLINAIASGVDLHSTQISEVIATTVITRRRSQLKSIVEVLSLLRLQQLPLLPVTDDRGRLFGVITAESICRVLELEEIEDTSETLCQLTENIREVLFVRDLKLNKLIYISPTYEEIWGRKRDRLYENSDELLNAIHPEDRSRVANAIASLASSQCYSQEYRIIRDDGAIRWIWTRAFPLYNRLGEVYRLIGISEDITEREQVEAELIQAQASLEGALTRSKDIFKSLFESISEQVWLARQDGSIEFVNKHLLEYYGCNLAEVLDYQWQQFIHSNDLPQCFEAWHYSVATGNIYDIELRILRHSDQTYRWHHVRAVPLRDARGQIFGWFGIHNDIHNRKLIEEVLRQSEERFCHLVGISSDIVWEMDTNAVYTYISPKVRDILGYEPEEVIGKTAFEAFLLPEEAEGTASIFMSIAAELPLKGMEVVKKHKDGHPVFMEMNGVPIFDAEGKYQGYRGVGVDITQRKRAEEDLLRFHKIVQSTCDAIGITDKTGVVTYLNPAFEQLFGYDVKAFNAAGGPAITNTNRVQSRMICDAIKAGNSWHGETQMRTRYGRTVPIDLRADVIKNTRGEIIGWFAIHTDISEQKRIESTLRLRDRAIAASKNGIIICDCRLPDMPIVYVNRAFEEITGYCAIEVIGRNCRFLQDNDTKQPEIQEIRNAVTRVNGCSVVFRNYRKDGMMFWNELTISPVLNSKGQLTHYIGIQIDVSDRKQAEVALRVSKDRIKYLLSSCPGAIYTRCNSRDLTTTFVSENITSLLGYEKRELLCNSNFWVNRIHSEDTPKVFAAISQILTHGQHIHEYRFLHKDGTYHWLLDQAKLLCNDAGNPLEIIGYLTDITERRKLEDDLKIALEKEKELNELKSRFVSMTSHEFRTPLSTIFSSSELLQHYRHKWSDEKQVFHLHRIQTSVKHLTKLLDDVLNIGKVDAGKFEFKPIFIDLLEYCHNLVEEIQINANETHKINFISSQSQPTPVWMDDKLLGHIFTNLLTNAIKYSPNGGIVDFQLIINEKQAIFTIVDQGIGIPSEDLPLLFDSFHRATNVSNIQGTGLGLAIVKKCVDIHQGEIQVISQLEIGTTFTVILPLGEVSRE